MNNLSLVYFSSFSDITIPSIKRKASFFTVNRDGPVIPRFRAMLFIECQIDFHSSCCRFSFFKYIEKVVLRTEVVNTFRQNKVNVL